MADQLAKLPRIPLPCPNGAWVTDGQRLADVIGVDDSGRYVLEDAHTIREHDKHGRLQILEHRIPILPDRLVLKWRLVRLPESEEVTSAGA